jgi:hypothetical protein
MKLQKAYVLTLLGLKGLLLSAFVARNYAQKLHIDRDDKGPTVVLRFTNPPPESPNAYHLVQPTLHCGQKRGLVCKQRQGSMTVFMADTISHTSTLNENGPNPDAPSLSVGSLQKMKVMNYSLKRAYLLDDMVSFPILKGYNCTVDSPDDVANAILSCNEESCCRGGEEHHYMEG